MAKEGFDREIGEIKNSLSYITINIDKLEEHNDEFFKRINSLEQSNVKRDVLDEELEKQKKSTSESVNTKLAIVAVVITIVGIIIDITLRYIFKI